MKPRDPSLLVTADHLRAVLRYEPDTGCFYWRRRTNPGIRSDCLAGSLHHSGYVKIKIGVQEYQAHRLAWFYVYGEWPPQETDHINGIKHDNRIVNLRPASYAQNNANRPKPVTNTTGYKGVSFHKTRGRFVASIGLNGRRYHLGDFSDPAAAHAVYMAKKREVYGEFVSLSDPSPAIEGEEG